MRFNIIVLFARFFRLAECIIPNKHLIQYTQIISEIYRFSLFFLPGSGATKYPKTLSHKVSYCVVSPEKQGAEPQLNS